MTKKEMILEHVWQLFQNLNDDNNEAVIDACWFFHKVYDFEIDVLPDGLYNKMIELKREDMEYSNS